MHWTGWMYSVGASALAGWAAFNGAPLIPIFAAILVGAAIVIRLGMILEK